MTISSTGARASYVCNGTTVNFPYPYPFFAAGDLLVLLFNTSTNLLVVPQPVLNGGGTYDYTVNGTQDAATGEYLSGATLTANNAPPSPYKWVIVNAIPLTQGVSLQDNSKYFAGILNAGLDRVTLLTQQWLLSSAYAILAPYTDEAPALVLPPAALRANMLPAFDIDGNITTIALTGAPSVTTTAVLAFETFGAAQAAILALNDLIYVKGYAAAGDGGECHWRKVAAVPYHDVYFTAADGTIWVPAQSKFDPRAFGAKADVFVASQATISADNLSQIIIGDDNFTGFTDADVGKNIVLWDYPYAHALANTTIAGIASATVCNLTAPASAATTANCDCFFGTDDSAIINACMTLAANGSDAFGIGPPPRGPYNSSSCNTLAQGGHTLHFRALDENTSRYGIAAPVEYLNVCTLEWEENAALWALGNFAGAAMIAQNADPLEPAQLTLVNAKLHCNGFAPLGLLTTDCIYGAIKGGFCCWNGTAGGMVLGVDGYSANGTFDLDGRIHIEGISTTLEGYVNNAAGIGLWLANSADTKCSGNVEIVNYRTGMRLDDGDCDFGNVHVWTNTNGGYLTTGVVMNSEDISIARLLVDTPWAPAGTLCYGAVINGISDNIGHLSINLNTGAATIQDNSVVAVQYNNANYAPPGTYLTARLGSRIGTIWTQSASAAVRLKQVVDASLASNVNLDIGSINTDGNVYDIGWYTEAGLARLSQDVTAVSNASLIAALAHTVAAADTPLWSPAANASVTPFWLDASQGIDVDVDQSGNVRGWFSRGNSNKALQSGRGLRPAWEDATWTGTYLVTSYGVSFDGATTMMLLDDIIDYQSDVRVFMAVVPKATGGGPMFQFNNREGTFCGLLRLKGSGTAIYATDNGATGTNSITVAAGTPYLVSAIWSTSGTSGGSNGAGSTVRAYWSDAGTGTAIADAAVNALLAQIEPVEMGGVMTGNVLSQPAEFTVVEMIVVLGPMDLAQEEIYEGYLAWKYWGSSGGNSYVLPSGHPYYGGAPTA